MAIDVTELQQKSEEDVQSLLRDKRALLRSLRFQAHEKQLKQVHQVAEVRKDIARLLTVLRQRRRVHQTVSVT